MSAVTSISAAKTHSGLLAADQGSGESQAGRPLVSLVISVYNEAAILETNLYSLCQYMKSLEDEYHWEIILINDGSTDNTGALAEIFARGKDNVRVFHHVKNFGLGQAFQLAFDHCRGDYIVTLDIDLSYSPDHIQKLLIKIRDTQAKIVVASPYMAGGKTSDVPWLRRTLSIWANRFLSITAKGNVSTLTGMVRAYDAKFLRALNLKSPGMEVNPEIIYKAMLLHAQVEEIPAHLDWHLQKAEGAQRRSSMRVLRHTFAVLHSGFLFRPVMFFITPGLALFLFAFYVNTWMIIHFLDQYRNLPQYTWFFSRASAAVAAAYQQSPHTFIVGGLASMLAIQLMSLGILALQSKSYFEEMFHLGANIYRLSRAKNGDEQE